MGKPIAMASRLLTLALLFIPLLASAQTLQRLPEETATEFAHRNMPEGAGLTGTIKETEEVWNGSPAILAFYDRVYAQTYSDGTREIYHSILPTLYIGEGQNRYTEYQLYDIGPEGGDPVVEDSFFANADDDPETEIVVIISWNQKHYDVNGVLYATYIFDDREGVAGSYPYLQALSGHFMGCDCAYREGTVKEAEFKTKAQVKAELERLGYQQR